MRTAKKRRATKMLRDKDRVLSCAHQASRRLLRKTAILTQMLRPRNSATAKLMPCTYILRVVRNSSSINRNSITRYLWCICIM